MVSLLFCAACATSQTARPEPTSAAAAPAVPSDPLALVVEEPESVAVVRVQELQSAALFERLRPYIERAACIKLADWSSVLSATRRAALAARKKPEQAPEWLAVLDGQYSDADAHRLLGLALERSHAATGEPARETRDSTGRFGVTEQGTLAVSVLENRILVLGTQLWVRAALQSIAQPVAKFSDNAAWQAVALPLGCSERTACLFWRANSSGAHQLQRGLSGAGAKDLGQTLEGSDSVVSVTVRDALGLGYAAQVGSVEAAKDAERALREWLWQVNLVVRLTGMPAIFDRARLSTQNTLVRGELDVSQAELDAYESRARPLFEREISGSCDAAQP